MKLKDKIKKKLLEIVCFKRQALKKIAIIQEKLKFLEPFNCTMLKKTRTTIEQKASISLLSILKAHLHLHLPHCIAFSKSLLQTTDKQGKAFEKATQNAVNACIHGIRLLDYRR